MPTLLSRVKKRDDLTHNAASESKHENFCDKLNLFIIFFSLLSHNKQRKLLLINFLKMFSFFFAAQFLIIFPDSCFSSMHCIDISWYFFLFGAQKVLLYVCVKIRVAMRVPLRSEDERYFLWRRRLRSA